jgi:hypothetical protein
LKPAIECRAFGASPYTPRSVDVAIAYLEQILCAENAGSLFAQAYWRGRVLQAFATPGLVNTQRDRLRRLLDRLENEPFTLALEKSRV